MSFNPKNRDHKKQLYRVLRALADITLGSSPLDFLDDAVGKPLVRGTDYLSNVRKGDFSSPIATLTHQWLEKNHFDLAHRIAPDVFPDTPEMRFRKLVNEHAVRGKLRVVPANDDLGIVERASKAQSADVTIKLGQPFYFELDSDEDGYVVMYQALRNQWHPVGLGPNDEPCIPVRKGLNTFPHGASGQPDPIEENNDLGVHEFVAVVGKEVFTATSPTQNRHMSQEDDVELHRLSVIFRK